MVMEKYTLMSAHNLLGRNNIFSCIFIKFCRKNIVLFFSLMLFVSVGIPFIILALAGTSYEKRSNCSRFVLRSRGVVGLGSGDPLLAFYKFFRLRSMQI